MMNQPELPKSGANPLAQLPAALRLSEPQQFGAITIIPMHWNSSDGPFYISLTEALKRETLIIREVSASGSVPELLAENRGESPVLVVDGEELRGAKQNRVLNTTLLLKERCSTKIPVSCTEAGRWHYKTRQFLDSGHIMSQKARAKKLKSVSEHLNLGHAYLADQGEVWNEVDMLHFKAKSHSPTKAMSDAFAQHESDLRQCLDTFVAVPEQAGLIVFFGRRLAGCDLVSRPEVYASLHAKFTKSYAIEFLFDRQTVRHAPAAALESAQQFLHQVASTECKPYDSIGYGQSYRFTGRQLVGAALVHDRHLIHVTVLNPAADGSEDEPRRGRYHPPFEE